MRKKKHNHKNMKVFASANHESFRIGRVDNYLNLHLNYKFIVLQVKSDILAMLTSYVYTILPISPLYLY